MSVRTDRGRDELRPVTITRDYIMHAEGSVLIEVGGTKVICTATVDEKVPPFLKGTGQGWVTAEYSMIPRATKERNVRDSTKGRPSGRSQEIQRLIGRALRSVVDLNLLGERTIWIDCDVIQADGGTRTASITGAYVALVDAISRINFEVEPKGQIVTDSLAAVSVGIIGGEKLLDLCFEEDSVADVDMNIVMTGSGNLVEVQGTAEGAPFSRADMLELMDLAEKGIRELLAIQDRVLGR